MYFLFWLFFFMVFYAYVGYGILIFFLAKNRKQETKLSFPDVNDISLPTLTLLIAAYNEASIIESKIANSRNLIYPNGKFQIVLVTDGSNDSTVEVLSNFPNITTFHQEERRGKSAAINRVMPFIKTDVVVFNDANTFLNQDALLLMARHYSDQFTGGVSGEKRVISSGGVSGKKRVISSGSVSGEKRVITSGSTFVEKNAVSGAGEGLYWKYESFLKRLDAQYFSLIGAAGELFSIRTALYEPIPEDTILDDFIISLHINQKGYRIAYEPDATASEEPSFNMEEEKKRKIRISAGGFQAMSRLPGLWRFDRHFKLSFMFVSHRVSRWTFAPLSLLMLPFINLYVVLRDLNPFYVFTLVLQLFFYAGAALAYYYSLKNIKLRGLYICYYFLFMNLSVFYGFFRFIGGRQSAVWEKAKR